MTRRHLSRGARVALRTVAAATIAGSAMLSFTARAHADFAVTLEPTTEAWYQSSPSCSTPVGCVVGGAVPATNPFPRGTLHVAMSGGSATARSYLAFSLSGMTDTVVTASLAVPLDTAPADGDITSSSARLRVCLTFAVLQPVEGAFDPPPTTDCSSATPVTYFATPQPHLAADLASLLPDLAAATGLVLLPDETTGTPAETWHVVFSAHTRVDAAKTPPATLTLAVETPPATDDRFLAPSSDAPLFSAVEPPLGTEFAAAPSTEAIAGEPPPLPQRTRATVNAAPRFARGSYPYRVVWLIPLGFVVLFPTLANAMTKDFDVVDRRRTHLTRREG